MRSQNLQLTTGSVYPPLPQSIEYHILYKMNLYHPMIVIMIFLSKAGYRF